MILETYITVACISWVMIYAYLAWSLRHIPRLEQMTWSEKNAENQPLLSIIIPACNEAGEIEQALRSLVAQDYPHLEIIVINDRSTDNTGQIIERVARDDSRIKTVHIESLPDGWLGKVHALHIGVQQAGGDWLLFTDADVHFAPGALHQALAYATHEKLDQLSLFPRVITVGFWLGVAVRSFGLLYLYTTRAAQVHKPNNDRFIGVGAFNLVRRSAYERTPGFEWLRLETADDAALGMMLKQAGAVVRFAIAESALSMNWYASLQAMFRGLEKNLFGAGAHYQWWRMAGQVVSALALIAAPIIGIGYGYLHAQGIVMFSVTGAIISWALFALRFSENEPVDLLYLLMFPVGILLINIMLLNSAYRCLRSRGINWRGTHYSLSELRQGQRLKF